MDPEAPEQISFVETWISNIWCPEIEENTFLLCEVTKVLVFVIAVLTQLYNRWQSPAEPGEQMKLSGSKVHPNSKAISAVTGAQAFLNRASKRAELLSSSKSPWPSQICHL